MKMPAFEIISKAPTPSEIQFLDDMVYEYNISMTKHADGKLFCKLIYDTDNNIIAGTTGWTWAGACEITFLWVKEEYRKSGYGRKLLEAAEAEAKKEGCQAILLRTYSFQAPSFYQKLGYTIENEMKNFPPGHSLFSLVKRVGK